MPTFYHLSDTWDGDEMIVYPRNGRVDSDDPRDMKPFIAVCPMIEHCVVAVGEWIDYDHLTVYSCEVDDAEPAGWVFDTDITFEHRLYSPTLFKRVGVLYPEELLETIPYVQMSGNLSDKKLRENIAYTLQNLLDSRVVETILQTQRQHKGTPS